MELATWRAFSVHCDQRHALGAHESADGLGGCVKEVCIETATQIRDATPSVNATPVEWKMAFGATGLDRASPRTNCPTSHTQTHTRAY
jgi:hypothetical protein